VTALSSQSIFLSNLVLGVAIYRHDSLRTAGHWSPVTPNSGSLQATAPVGGQGMEIVPASHPLPTTDFYASSNTESFAPARAESGPCRHPYSTSRLCDNKAPDLTWLHVISRLTPGTGRANPQVVGALLRARSRKPFGWYGDGFGTATIDGGNRDTRRVLISVRC
jgi:hypothetical protein